ncbi:MAG: hypothetical protein AAB630_01610 [Patescibacteria group bacterium]
MSILSWILDERAEMTVSITRNPGHLTHQDGCGGAVTLTATSRKNIIECSRCNAKAEFAPFYATILRFTKEDGKERSFRFSRYRDRQVRGRLTVISAPSAH